MSEIPSELVLEYKKIVFRVLEPQACTLWVGRHSAELQSLFVELGVTYAGYLTACNPFSGEASGVDNEHAQRQLLGQLSLEGVPALNALGIDPSGDWPGEESVFVPGLSLDQAKSLGSEFSQNAIVWAGPDAVPQLVLLR